MVLEFDRHVSRSTDERSSEASSSEQNFEERRSAWSRDAFTSLGGLDGRLPLKQIKAREFNAWFRALVTDMLARGHLPPSKVVRTTRLVALLVARAAGHGQGSLPYEEFHNFTTVIMDPSPGTTLEEELVWSLIDLNRAGFVYPPEDKLAEVRELWVPLGLQCTEEQIQQVLVESEEEDDGTLTAQRYHDLYQEAQPLVVPPPQRAPTADRLLRPPFRLREKREIPGEEGKPPVAMQFGRPQRIQDCYKRSAEIGALSLHYEPSKPERPPPVRRRKLLWIKPQESVETCAGADSAPLDAPESCSSSSLAARSILPPLSTSGRGGIDWQQQEDAWNQRAGRLYPFMKVNATYKRADGKTATAVGTLLSGWAVKQKLEQPHSARPEGVRGWLPPAVPPHMSEAAKMNDTANYVVVQVHGVERLIPRANVTPCGS